MSLGAGNKLSEFPKASSFKLKWYFAFIAPLRTAQVYRSFPNVLAFLLYP